MTNFKAQISNKCQGPNTKSKAAKTYLPHFPPKVDKTLSNRQLLFSHFVI